MARKASRVTIYDVAQQAGVAISTVSRVLNDSPDVANKTRERVLQTIDDLKYRPNRVAKALAQPRSTVIAIAIPTFTTPFHNELLKGLRTVLAGEDHDLLLFDLGSVDPLERLRNKLKGGTVDGLILAGIAVDPPLARELKALRAPVVLIGNHHTRFDSFFWDDTEGARTATSHLIESGHKHVGMIRAYTDGYLQLQRIRGYREALSEHSIDFDPRLVQSGTTEKHAGFSEEHGFEAMQRLLDATPRPTAVLASSDVQAIGAWKAIRDSGLSVPRDIALVGYDDIKTSYYIGLSSVDQRIENTGQSAAERLMFRLDNPGTRSRVDKKVTPTLRIRYSSKYKH